MTLVDFATRLADAFVLGSVVGFKREYRQRMAGLRTKIPAALPVLLTIDGVS